MVVMPTVPMMMRVRPLVARFVRFVVVRRVIARVRAHMRVGLRLMLRRRAVGLMSGVFHA
jgi:hypothetical protein